MRAAPAKRKTDAAPEHADQADLHQSRHPPHQRAAPPLRAGRRPPGRIAAGRAEPGTAVKARRKTPAHSLQFIPGANYLLATLPRADRQRLLADCVQIELTAGEVLCEPKELIRNVYFPTSSFISLVIPVDQHASLEIDLIGNEGMLGFPVVLGANVSPLRALVQGSGSALRITAAGLRRQLDLSPALRARLHLYGYVLLTQLAQTAACIHFHALDARLAHWILMTNDRAHCNAFFLTQEIIAEMLGVRRVGVTVAAGVLQRRKLISYSRGNITVLDRAGLEAASCRCYQEMKETYRRILG